MIIKLRTIMLRLFFTQHELLSIVLALGTWEGEGCPGSFMYDWPLESNGTGNYANGDWNNAGGKIGRAVTLEEKEFNNERISSV